MPNKTKQQKQQKKKTVIGKYKLKDLSVVELIKANSMLSQNCINLSNHLTRCEMDISSLYHQNLYLKHEIGDLKGILESDMDIQRDLSGDGENSELSKGKISKEQKEQNPLPFHDDLTAKCPICNTINHKDVKSCGECGYKK